MLSDELEGWAKAQKRVTNKLIREQFDVGEGMAQGFYDYLRLSGIVGRMGYVKRRWRHES